MDWEPVKGSEDRDDVVVLSDACSKAGGGILDQL